MAASQGRVFGINGDRLGPHFFGFREHPVKDWHRMFLG
jgi:hypothetical protein